MGDCMGKIDYHLGKSYWSTIPGTLNGVLGGFTILHEPDVRDSLACLNSLRSNGLLKRMHLACDCGAGIGRVARSVLDGFESVDMVDAAEHLLEAAKDVPNVGEVVVCGLQDFYPTKPYDMIWIQWVLSHLTDDDVVAFIKRACACVFAQDGVVLVKENVSKHSDYQYDDEDGSVTRSESIWLRLFNDSGATILMKRDQTRFPPQLFPVKLFVLQKRDDSRETG